MIKHRESTLNGPPDWPKNRDHLLDTLFTSVALLGG